MAVSMGFCFNVDTNNRFGWLYVDTGGGTPLFGIDVSVGRPTDSLVSVLPETVIDQPVNTVFGILRYGDKYIAAINGHAVAEVSAAKLSSAAQTSLTGSEIGIGTFTTFQRTDQYRAEDSFSAGSYRSGKLYRGGISTSQRLIGLIIHGQAWRRTRA